MIRKLGVLLVIGLAACQLTEPKPAPTWRDLPTVMPEGQRVDTGAHVVPNRLEVEWQRPPFHYDAQVATGRKQAKVVVVIYDPVLESEGGKRLTEHVGANDPLAFSHILANVIREASWGYVNYEIVDFLVIDDYPRKVDGFRYTDESFLEARAAQQWQPARISYRGVFEDLDLIERFRREGITELWLWGASGMHFDEFAMYVPNRYARYGPTDNPWLYRPYDIPEELGRSTFVMGFNYEVGADNMIHSYTHRVESMAALAYGDGIWDPWNRTDPWNVFTRLEKDAAGRVSQVGNCHYPPNAERDYDYTSDRAVLSTADHWHRFPDVRGPARPMTQDEWGRNQFGYQRWILERVPKAPGFTEHGVNNWWVHVANPDGDLPDWVPPDRSRFRYEDAPPTAVE